MPATPIELPFPVKGLDENWAYRVQPQGTTPGCLNVRGYDVLQRRLRGGQRFGVSKVFAGQVNGSNAIQELDVVSQSTQGAALVNETFTQANGQLSSTDWYPLEYGFGFGISATWPKVNSNKIRVVNTDAISNVAAVRKNFNLVANFLMTMDVSFTFVHADAAGSVSFVCKAVTSFPDWLDGFVISLGNNSDSYLSITGTTTTQYALTPGSGDYRDPAWWATPRTLKLQMTGNSGSVYVNDILLHTSNLSAYALGDSVGFIAYTSSPGYTSSTITIDNYTVSLAAAASNRTQKVIAVSGGNIYSGSLTSGLTLATAGTAAVVATGRVGIQDAFGKVYFCDGTSTHYKVLTLSSNTVATWTPSAGSLPVSGTNACRIMSLYRGRIVLSGLVDDPQNWFMSKAGDPLDWDYGATPSAIMAVAGNNSVAGLVGDIITCLAPYNDDLMVIGGDHSLWMMRGDPADGGRIDNISQILGISGPKAAIFDPTGILYFFGNGVLWRMSPGGVPEPLSRGRIDKSLSAIDLNTSTVVLTWDSDRHGLNLFVVATSPTGSETHYFWDARTDSFWPDQYPVAVGPTCVLLYDGDSPTDRAIWLGGTNGYVRKFDPTSKTDDGITIRSRVKFGPVQPGGAQQNAKVSRALIRLDSTSSPVKAQFYAAESPQQVIAASTPNWAYEVDAYRPYMMPRLGGNSILLELDNNTFASAWVTATVYAVGNTVVNSGSPYICAIAHTSGTFATDLSAGKWTISTFRTWAVEVAEIMAEPTGRTRHGRL